MRRDGDLSATVIRYTEASAAMCDGPEVSAALASIVGVYREDFSEAPCLQKLLPFTRPKLKDPRLAAARDRLLAAARVPMGDAPLHERILMSLYAPGRVSNAAGGTAHARSFTASPLRSTGSMRGSVPSASSSSTGSRGASPGIGLASTIASVSSWWTISSKREPRTAR